MFNIKMPKSSIIKCGIAAFSSFLLIYWLNIRPLGIFFLVLFCFWFYKTRCNLRIVPPPELHKKYDQVVERTRAWRRNNPTMFCTVASGCLGVLAVLGHLISGSTVVLMGLVLAAIVSTKYNFKLVKIEHKDFDWSEKLNHDPELDDEFLPEVNESNLFVLERAGETASLSSPTDEAEEEEKSEEVPSELLIPDSIPEIDENSTDEEELVPVIQKGKVAALDAVSKSTDSASSSNVMEFKRGHFKRDSSLSNTSSSSEESLSKGLKFPDHTSVDGSLPASALPHNQEAGNLVASVVKTQTQALLANSGKLLPSLVSDLVQWGMGGSGAKDAVMPPSALIPVLDSSDESDFEILENDDFK